MFVLMPIRALKLSAHIDKKKLSSNTLVPSAVVLYGTEIGVPFSFRHDPIASTGFSRQLSIRLWSFKLKYIIIYNDTNIDTPKKFNVIKY